MNHEDGLPEDLARALRALDARAARRAERVDPARVADRVLERLRSKPEPARRVIRFPLPAPRIWVAAAAAAVVLAVGGVLARGGGPAHSTSVPVAMQALDSLSQSQLETVLAAAGEVRPVALEDYRSSSPTLDDLDEQQLRALLQAVQHVEGSTP